MPKLVLVNPVARRGGYMSSRLSTQPPLGLGYVAAATPAEWDVEIVDENISRFRYRPADLVGISGFTSVINRAYEIAEIYRRLGTTVVVGGIHASMMPDEVLQHADAVVIGEVEGVWPRVLADFQAERLSRKYEGQRVDLANAPLRARRDLFHPSYLWSPIQTSRGCPFDCNFCSVTKYLGKTYRQRTAADVLDELASIPGRYISFVDDNLIGNSERSRLRARELFEGMIARRLRKVWWMQTSINAADDEELLALASRAGCILAFVGFESIDDRSLEGMNKTINLRRGVDVYQKVVTAFHRHHIAVFGGFIIGTDYETPQYYQEFADFIVDAGIDVAQISIITPLPGTRFMGDLVSEDRLAVSDFPLDWARFRMSHVVYRPRGVDAATIYIGNNLLKRRLYSFPSRQVRMLRSLLTLRRPRASLLVNALNAALEKSWRGEHYYRQYPSRFA